MQKSFIDRVFPKPKTALLPQYDVASTYHDEPQRGRSTGTASTRTVSDSRSSTKSADVSTSLQPAPISASIIHHADPFLAIDRAAQNLQRTIQSLLDFQSQTLNGRHQDDESVSQRSPTPTQSATSGSLRNISSSSGAMPIRQPAKRKLTLKGARRGIGKSMHELVALKEEELRITEKERVHRRAALDQIMALETKRESVRHEINTLQRNDAGDEPSTLRKEVQTVQDEIHELEGRLMELKAKHRHLTDKAEQLESSTASELSSYQGTLTLVDKEVRTFLRHPPIRQTLGPRNLHQGQDMYSLRPERRTLELAREQWATELETLEQHKIDSERERDALIQGAKTWREAVQHIDEFEQLVRTRMKSNMSDSSSTSDILAPLDTTMHFLQQAIHSAEINNWNLLICAIGPELESFRQAKALLAPDVTPDPTDHPSDAVSNNPTTTKTTSYTDEDDSDVPHADLLDEHPSTISFQPTLDYATALDDHERGFPTTVKSTSSSNESLKATLRDMRVEPPSRRSGSFAMNMSSEKVAGRRATRYSESEDDDPGPDFLLSR